MKIIKCDALEFVSGLEDNCVQMVLIDPPYKKLHRLYKVKLHKHFERVCTGQIVIYGTHSKSNREHWLGIDYAYQVFPWIKPETTKNVKNGLAEYSEIIMTFRKVPVTQGLHNSQYSGIFTGRVASKEHPYKKPIGDIERLIRLWTKEGDTVLDCFAGTGTTGEAAERLGRKYLLGDINGGG